MAELTIERLIEQIHAAGTRLVLVTTGGGSLAISDLLTTSGASRTVLEATVPYSAAALIAWLGSEPEQYCSQATARSMAMAALRRAQTFDPAPGANLAGIACTASLASDRPKRGPHRAHLALQTSATTAAVSLQLEKGKRTRAEEERIVALLILNLIAEAAGLTDRVPVPLTAGEQPERALMTAPQAWQELIAGRIERLAVGGTSVAGTPSRTVLFPGAFNPLHAGHRRMTELAENLLGQTVEFELSVVNVDKPPLDFIEIDRRTRQFTAGQRIWLTRAPTFVEKSRMFQGPTFVVGADTIVRIADPRYYGGSLTAAQAAIDELISSGGRFLVFGRVMGDRFCTLSDLSLPESLKKICQEVSADVFREEVSSTQLRKRTG